MSMIQLVTRAWYKPKRGHEQTVIYPVRYTPSFPDKSSNFAVAKKKQRHRAMRALLINTSERIGGAAVACSRLMEALTAYGIKAKMLVRDKQTTDVSVVALRHSWKHLWHFLWERLVIWRANRFSRKNLFAVDIANAGTDVTSLPEFTQADIIHLHWINQGMLSLRDISNVLKSGKPVVWTMHDMWPCTGICHHARTCVGYQNDCGNCQYLNGKGSKHDLSYRVYRKKKRLLAGHRITFVTPSRWLQEQAGKSSLLRGQDIVCIPNPINTNTFRPLDKKAARADTGLPQDMQLLLFGSVKITDKRKGIDYMIEACRLLAQEHPELKETLGVIVIGSHSEQMENLLPFRVFAQDFVTDSRKLVGIYNAADIYVTPSLEENLPNTIMEAMACGVPCVGFNVGGIPEMIDHLHNGYIAQYKSAADFANGIYWLLTDPDRRTRSDEAVRKVQSHYSEQVVARQYTNLYNRLTDRNA